MAASSLNYSLWTVAAVVINPSVLVCTLLLTLVLIFRFGRSPRPADDSLPPSPWRLPIIGNLHQLSLTPHRWLHALSLKYGPIILLQLGSLPCCAVSSGDLATQVAKTHDSLFSERSKTKGARILLSGEVGITFSPENKHWRLTRKLCVTALLSTKSVKSMHYIRKEEVARLVTMIRSSCLTRNGSDQKIDLGDSFLKLAGSVVYRSVLGQTISRAEDDGRDSNEVKVKLALQTAHAITDWFSFEDFIPSLSWLDHLTGLNRKLKKTSQTIHAFLDQVIDEREAIIQSGNGGDENKCLVDIILELRKKQMTGLDLTRANIKAILLDMFTAGITTSATAMEWAMAELARNPRIMKKVQEEVRSVVGSKPEIHESDIDRMEYLKCIIKETLRLHGPTITMRQASSTTVTLGGFKLPANVTTLINIWAIHRDPAAWDKPLEFLPERFLNTSYNFKGQDQVYFPFGLGRRICPAVQFAMSEVEYALANVLCWFDWELPDGVAAEDIDMRGSTSLLNRKIVPLCLVPVPMPSPAQCT